MTEDERTIRALVGRHAEAIRERDAEAAINCFAADIVSYDLAPPLAFGPAEVRSAVNLEEWFATWSSPIVLTDRDLTVRLSGDVAYGYSLRHMTGTKVDGFEVELWFRFTAGFVREAQAWKIDHIHESVPFAMDGSGLALLDLKP